MRKKLLSMLLSLTMMVVMLPVATMDSEAKQDSPWTRVRAFMATDPENWCTIASRPEFDVSVNTETNTMEFKLKDDIKAVNNDDISGVLRVLTGITVIIDLNGHTMDKDCASSHEPVPSIFKVEYGGTLIIRDSSNPSTGKITGGCASHGGAIECHGETILEGGTITGCRALSDVYDSASSQKGRGGAIYVTADTDTQKGSFQMKGGKIENCFASVAGGAVFVVGSMDLSGGCISNCSVSGVEDSGIVKAKGGAVYLYGNSNFSMTGGEITNNTLGNVADTRGAGLYVAQGAGVTLGGTAKINNNSVSATDVKSNMFLYDGVLLDVATGVNAPCQGMNIGVTTKKALSEGAPSCAISTPCNDCSAYFFSDRSKEYVKYANGILSMQYGDLPDIESELIPGSYPIWDSPEKQDEELSGLVKTLKISVSKIAANRNGKISLAFKALALENGTKATNYQVRRSTNRNFTKNIKKYNASCSASSDTVSFTNAKGLKKGTKYYYKIRAKVQLSNGNYVYSKWSDVKSAKCKKTR